MDEIKKLEGDTRLDQLKTFERNIRPQSVSQLILERMVVEHTLTEGEVILVPAS
jgi:hypothetical protein